LVGRVLCTAGTRELSALLLPDSGHLQEEDARYANRRGYSKHHPALPLYTARQAEAAVERLESFPYDVPRRRGRRSAGDVPPGWTHPWASAPRPACGRQPHLVQEDLADTGRRCVADPDDPVPGDALILMPGDPRAARRRAIHQAVPAWWNVTCTPSTTSTGTS